MLSDAHTHKIDFGARLDMQRRNDNSSQHNNNAVSCCLDYQQHSSSLLVLATYPEQKHANE